MEKIFHYIHSNQERFRAELETLVRQPSNSSSGEGLEACARLLQALMEASGIETRILPTDGAPIVYGESPGPPGAITVLIYGHYDVKPPEPLSSWISPPYQPDIRNGRIYGRGTADEKGQVLAHLKGLESILAVGRQLPVNVKFLFEGEEEIASPSLKSFVEKNRPLLKTDLMYSSDGTMTFDGKPAVLLGVRGILKIEISCRGGSEDVHSGNLGGLVPNPAWSLVHLLKTMKGEDGKVLIEGFYTDVLPPTSSEQEALERMGFDEEAFRKDYGLRAMDTGPGTHPLQRLMFWPTFNIQGFFAGTPEAEGINIIPAKARVVIDMRLVPNQTPGDILHRVKNHIERMRHLGDFAITLKTQVSPFRTPMNHPYMIPVVEAVRQGFEQDPVVIPSVGWSDPTHIFGNLLRLPCFKVPYAQHDSQAHAPNENLRLDIFEKSIRTTAALLFALARQREE